MIFVFDINQSLLTKLVWLSAKIMISMIFVDVINLRLLDLEVLTVNKNYDIHNFCVCDHKESLDKERIAIDKNYEFHDFCF